MLETERLYHRPFTPEDLPRLIEMRVDPAVNVYLGGAEMQNPASLAKRIEFYIECFEKYGLGMWAMFWRETDEMIGWSGLQPLEDTSEIEVGYGMIEKFWGRGIGFETAKMWLDYGFGEKKLERIAAVAYPENTGSRQIMEKLGMTYEKTETHYGSECVFYGISREDFFENRRLHRLKF